MENEAGKRVSGAAALPDETDTPYAFTLKGLRQPWTVVVAFNVLTALAIGLIGSPVLACLWLVCSLGLDAALQSLYRGWLAAPSPPSDLKIGLRLTVCAALRSSCWMAASIMTVVQTHSPAAYAFLAIEVGTLALTAAAIGRASREVWIASLAPAVLGAAALAVPHLAPQAAAGLAIGIAIFVLSSTLIRTATGTLIGEAAASKRRLVATLEELRTALTASGEAERLAEKARALTARSQDRLILAMEMARMHIFEIDYRRGELIKTGDEGIFFTEQQTFESLTANIYGSVDPRDLDEVKAAWSRHFRDGAPFHPEYRIIRSDDREVWTTIRLQLITDESGRPTRLIGTLQDITERKQAEQRLLLAKEQAEAANRTKSQFLANMSHEIRTPMNGVIGMNELLLRTPLDSDQRKYAEAVKTSADCLLDIINDILDLSKLEAGKVDLEAIDFSLTTLVEDVAELLGPKAAGKGLEIACHVDAGARRPLKGDPTRLRQVLLNLTCNAIKFTESGHVAVEVRSEPAANGGARLRIEVQDTGIGLTDAQKARLFQNFQQADGSTTRKYGGTGLGLSISRQLVELMGGRIGVQDGAAGGSTFWFEVELPSGAEPQTAPSAPRSLAGVRVVVVDDLAINRTIFREQLEAEGALVCEADSGEACLAQLACAQTAGAPFDLVLSDYQMPGMGGDTLVARIRDGEGWRQPKIVVASSMGGPPAGASGHDAFLVKPVRRSALIGCLGAVVAGGVAPCSVGPEALQLQEAEAQAHVLLAEDNEINILLTSEILRQVGISVEVVKTGVDAVAAARERRFDLILMDMHMPQMDGIEATRLIRRLPSPACDVPIIAMTANAMKSDMEACRDCGMDDFVSKPLRVDAFLAALDRALGGAADEGETSVAA